jgi:hypothetical protein
LGCHGDVGFCFDLSGGHHAFCGPFQHQHVCLSCLHTNHRMEIFSICQLCLIVSLFHPLIWTWIESPVFCDVSA